MFMNEAEVTRLYRALARCRDAFMQGRCRGDERHSVEAKRQRDRELAACFRNR